jgi:hypothetical protein
MLEDVNVILNVLMKDLDAVPRDPRSFASTLRMTAPFRWSQVWPSHVMTQDDWRATRRCSRATDLDHWTLVIGILLVIGAWSLVILPADHWDIVTGI